VQFISTATAKQALFRTLAVELGSSIEVSGLWVKKEKRKKKGHSKFLVEAHDQTFLLLDFLTLVFVQLTQAFLNSTAPLFARDRFLREAVLEHGYLASQVAEFLACHPSNVSRALQKS